MGSIDNIRNTFNDLNHKLQANDDESEYVSGKQRYSRKSRNGNYRKKSSCLQSNKESKKNIGNLSRSTSKSYISKPNLSKKDKDKIGNSRYKRIDEVSHWSSETGEFIAEKSQGFTPYKVKHHPQVKVRLLCDF